jgi:hypothetical protein
MSPAFCAFCAVCFWFIFLPFLLVLATSVASARPDQSKRPRGRRVGRTRSPAHGPRRSGSSRRRDPIRGLISPNRVLPAAFRPTPTRAADSPSAPRVRCATRCQSGSKRGGVLVSQRPPERYTPIGVVDVRQLEIPEPGILLNLLDRREPSWWRKL